MSQPRISVVTAAYNALEALRGTVVSVAAQDFPGVEHVIVDGGSTDGTRTYLESLPASVRWVSEPDGGIADAMNKGFAMARGDYVIVIQAGDSFAASGSLTRAASLLESEPDLAAFAVRQVRGADATVHVPRGMGALSGLQMTMPHQGQLLRRELFERIGPFDASFRIAMDYDLLLRARAAGARVVCSDEVLSVMPADGISSRPDWPGVSRRLAEFRRAQRRYLQGAGQRLLHEVYWLAYMPYKRLRVALGQG